MIVAFSWQNIVKHGSLLIKIAIITIAVIYILPKILSAFWNLSNPDPIKERNLMEKPLRVIVHNIA